MAATRLLVALLILNSALAVRGETLSLSAAMLYERSVTEGLRLVDDGAAIKLTEGELVEDDGPAAGYTYKPNVENLSGDVRIRKTLVLSRAAAKGAALLIAPGGELRVAVNGREAELDGPRKVGGYWQAYSLDPSLLRAGANEFVIGGIGKVWIARDQDYAAGSRDRTRHPNRSAKSRDGGRAWDDARLGAGDDLDGEYYVRLLLDRHLPEGRLTTPVIDLGNLADKPIAAAAAAIGEVGVNLDVEETGGGRVAVRARRGGAFVPSETSWAPWVDLQESTKGKYILPPSSSDARYLQLEIRLTAGDPRFSPRLKSLAITAKPALASTWTDKLRLVEAKNSPVVRSSIPFKYEPFDHPQLQQLRREQRLDDVVEGARSELELIERLAAWSSARWPKLGHLGEAYPPWDALQILAPHGDGSPVGGFCLQYNLVFLQACESFGIPGRVVSIGPGDHLQKIRGGHETVEVWSNQFEKWLYVDGNTAWHAVDEATGAPLSLLELRERQLVQWKGGSPPPLRVVKLAETRYEWPDLESWPPFVELRLVPRSNFLEQASPLPLNQGMRGWFWTGHYVWTDDAQPARPLYSHRVVNRRNWEWTLNHAHIVLEPRAEPGELRVHLDSNTPGLELYTAKT
ncbi:MAG: transglutaminase-like domain-containing protein, partial [Planctomycetes bacterium]|nr:transglutaminase-like domain-containing protein [Planctomycetota bacterium]